MQVLDALTMLGLRNSLTLMVMVDAATALQQADSADPSAYERAIALVHQLDNLAQGIALCILQMLQALVMAPNLVKRG